MSHFFSVLKTFLKRKVKRKEGIVPACLLFRLNLISPSSELFLRLLSKNHPLLPATRLAPCLLPPFKDILIGMFVCVKQGSNCVFGPPLIDKLFPRSSGALSSSAHALFFSIFLSQFGEPRTNLADIAALSEGYFFFILRVHRQGCVHVTYCG